MLLGLEKRLESVDKLLRYQSDSSIFHTIAGLRPEAHVQGRQVVLDSDTLQQYPALLLCQETVSVHLGCFLREHIGQLRSKASLPAGQCSSLSFPSCRSYTL